MGLLFSIGSSFTPLERRNEAWEPVDGQWRMPLRLPRHVPPSTHQCTYQCRSESNGVRANGIRPTAHNDHGGLALSTSVNYPASFVDRPLCPRYSVYIAHSFA